MKYSLNVLAVSTAKQVFALVNFNSLFPTTAATYHLHNNTYNILRCNSFYDNVVLVIATHTLMPRLFSGHCALRPEHCTGGLKRDGAWVWYLSNYCKYKPKYKTTCAVMKLRQNVQNMPKKQKYRTNLQLVQRAKKITTDVQKRTYLFR